MTTMLEPDPAAQDRDATAPPTPTGDGPTRRRFLGLALAGGAGATAVGLAGGSAAAAAAPAATGVTPASRAHYEVFQPGRLGPLRLKNRLVRSAAYMNTGSWHPETEGEVTDETIRVHREWAEGEVSMTMTGYMAVMAYGKKRTHVCAYDDKFIPGLTRLASAIHGVGNDCRIVAEIGHDGTSSPNLAPPYSLSPTGAEWGLRIGPSGIDWQGERTGHILTLEEIDRFTTDMAEAARRLQEAGFDGINIHGAHHYLINTFLSPFTNRRTDRYGGSMEKRVEIVREIVAKTRDRVGKDFAIIIKLNCDDGEVDDGTKEEVDIRTFPRLALLVEKAGVDAIDVSGDNPIRTGIDDPKEQSYYQAYTAKLQGLRIPVILSGGNRDVELLEALYKKQKGNIDYFAFARPLIRQPHLIKQWRDGGDAKSECINVSLCFRAMGESPPRTAHCVVLERLKQAQEEATASLGSGQAGIYGV
jgi:2,4-dienoyl-CoA reductase-like NADH-dependent reductase (Old Yellow Enzyme family)